jgi:hypothetical protein
MSATIFGLVQSMMNVASSSSGHSAPLPLGYLVVGIIMAPVVILIIATLVGEPRQSKITTVFFAFIAMMIVVFIGAVFGLSALLGIFY